MIKVKICGIRRQEDIEIINEQKPEYCGFVFAPSKRQVSIKEASVLIRRLDPSVKPIGVFANQDIEFVLRAAGEGKIRGVQLHGRENEDYINSLRKELSKDIEIWKYIPANEIEKGLLKYKQLCDMPIIDGVNPGSGEEYDKTPLKNIDVPYVLAGGLNIHNVRQVLLTLSPYCIDVSSGVEGSNGYKSEELICKFIKEVRRFYHE